MKQPLPNPVSAPTAYPAPSPAGQARPPIMPHLASPQPGMPGQAAPVQAPHVQPNIQNPAVPAHPPALAQQQQPSMAGAPAAPYGAPLHGAPPLQHAQPGQAMPHPAQVQPHHVPVPPQQAAPQGMPQQQGAPMGIPNPALHAPMPEENKEGGEKALPRISIHAFCERSETAGTIQATTQDWRMARTNVKIYMGGLPAAIEYYHKEGTPGLILFESGMRGQELFAQLDQLASVCDSNTKVVMIGAANDIRLYRELMEKGLSDYIVPPFHPLTLIRALSDLYSDPDKPFVGRVVAFFGAKGGVGSSTLAHNIAWGLAGKMLQETALVDMDSSWGTTGLDFNYDNTQGLEEALADHERLDETLLDRIMVRHTDKLSILPAAASLGSTAPTAPEAYEALVEGVRSLSPLTVLDMPHMWTEWTSQMLVRADEVVLTATPDLANLRNTKNLVDFLKAARPNDAEPLLVLNKTGVPKTAEIPVKEFAAAVGLDPALVLPYEPGLYIEAMNEGKMLGDIKAAAPSFEGMMYLAHRLKTGQYPSMQPTKKRRLRKKSKKTDAGAQELGQPEQTEQKSKKSLFAKLKKRK